MATILDAGGARYPSEYQGRALHPLEGKSLVPTFQGRQRELHDAIYWEHEGNKAISSGDWKLVARFPDRWELFNLVEDHTELTDLAASHPEKVKEMSGLWDAWAKRSQVVPWAELHQPV